MHMVAASFDIKQMDASSKMNPRWDFFLFMFQHGREQMEKWLRSHKADIGHKASVDIQEQFLGEHRRAVQDSKKAVKRAAKRQKDPAHKADAKQDNSPKKTPRKRKQA